MSALSEFEIAVLDLLLAGEIRALQVLRAQRERLSVVKREFTGVGFLTEFGHPPDVVRLQTPRRVRFGDVLADIEGMPHGAGFVLFIDDGVITVLEGYSTANEAWPESVGRYALRYWPPERDLGALVSPDEAKTGRSPIVSRPGIARMTPSPSGPTLESDTKTAGDINERDEPRREVEQRHRGHTPMNRLEAHVHARSNRLSFEAKCPECGNAGRYLCSLRYGFVEGHLYQVGDRILAAPEGFKWSVGEPSETDVVVRCWLHEEGSHSPSCGWAARPDTGQVTVRIKNQVIVEAVCGDDRFLFGEEEFNGVCNSGFIAPYLVLGPDGKPLPPHNPPVRAR